MTKPQAARETPTPLTCRYCGTSQNGKGRPFPHEPALAQHERLWCPQRPTTNRAIAAALLVAARETPEDACRHGYMTGTFCSECPNDTAVAARETLRPDPLDVMRKYGMDRHASWCVPSRECTCMAQVYTAVAAALRAATPDPAEPGLREALEGHTPSGGESMDGHGYVECSCGWGDWMKPTWVEHLYAALGAIR